MKKKLEINDVLVLEFREEKLFYTSQKFVKYYPTDSFMRPLKNGIQWEVSVKRIDHVPRRISVEVLNYDTSLGIQSFQDDLLDDLQEILFKEIDTQSLLGQQDRSGTLPKRIKTSSESPRDIKTYFEPLRSSPEKVVPPLKSRRISPTIQAEIKLLSFEEGKVSYDATILGAKTPVRLEIEDEAIQEAFGEIKPYFRKHLGSESIPIFTDIEINEQGIGRCLYANAPKLLQVVRKDIEQIRTDLLFDQFFDSNSPSVIFQEVGALTAIAEKLGAEKLNTKRLIEKLQEYQSARHSLELNYIAEHHRNDLMSLHYLKEAQSFLFAIEGKNQHHLVLEVYDKKLATYIWHSGKNHSEFEEKVAQVKESAAMLSMGSRQAFKSSQNKVEFKAINHSYEGDIIRNFEEWRYEFELACD